MDNTNKKIYTDEETTKISTSEDNNPEQIDIDIKNREEQTKVVTNDQILEDEGSKEEAKSLFDVKKIKIDARKVIVLSDIHSNMTAFNAILNDIKTREYDAIFCLGDLVGYYTQPNEVLNKVREIVDVCVMGNHDFALIEPEILLYSTLQEGAKIALDHNKTQVSEENKDWVSKLPMKIIVETPYSSVTLVHGDPVTIFGYIYGVTDQLFEQSINNALMQIDTDYLMVGHSHLQGEYFSDFGKVYVNPGAVGQPRDKDPRAAYAIVDLATRSHELIRVPYDIAEVKEMVIECCFPVYLADRLEVGE
ncbi:MAG: metallophosphatase family protein [Candidatus Heimdallarchaeota archaeon]|nr:metallophosphatase family protein [Candidatus Heimdallarchaeota archaeon]MDH5645254.1 metallophosphatase family protein [Candidatus Heimdallarchaeota archaeon]